MKSILDKGFKYVPAASTDITKTFARIRRELKEKAEQEKVKPIARVHVILKGKL